MIHDCSRTTLLLISDIRDAGRTFFGKNCRPVKDSAFCSVLDNEALIMSARLFGREQWEKMAIRTKFDAVEMANLCRVSPRQLQRDFQKAFQKTPTKWVRQFRCRLVLELISKGYANKAIVEELNFASQSHLCHDF